MSNTKKTKTLRAVEPAEIAGSPEFGRPVRVVNPKWLPAVVISRGQNVLGKDEIDLVRRQLEERCRDVEY